MTETQAFVAIILFRDNFDNMTKNKKDLRCMKNRTWEKERRERLNITFDCLAKLLPDYKSKVTFSKIDTLQRAIAHIEDLKQRVSTAAHMPKDSEIELKEQIRFLKIYNDRLMDLLRNSNIAVPLMPNINDESGNISKDMIENLLCSSRDLNKLEMYVMNEAEIENIPPATVGIVSVTGKSSIASIPGPMNHDKLIVDTFDTSSSRKELDQKSGHKVKLENRSNGMQSNFLSACDFFDSSKNTAIENARSCDNKNTALLDDIHTQSPTLLSPTAAFLLSFPIVSNRVIEPASNYNESVQKVKHSSHFGGVKSLDLNAIDDIESHRRNDDEPASTNTVSSSFKPQMSYDFMTAHPPSQSYELPYYLRDTQSSGSTKTTVPRTDNNLPLSQNIWESTKTASDNNRPHFNWMTNYHFPPQQTEIVSETTLPDLNGDLALSAITLPSTYARNIVTKEYRFDKNDDSTSYPKKHSFSAESLFTNNNNDNINIDLYTKRQKICAVQDNIIPTSSFHYANTGMMSCSSENPLPYTVPVFYDSIRTNITLSQNNVSHFSNDDYSIQSKLKLHSHSSAGPGTFNPTQQNSISNTITNFNLSTICPEIYK